MSNIILYLVIGVVSLTFVSLAFEVYLDAQREEKEIKDREIKLKLNRLTIIWSVFVSFLPLLGILVWYGISPSLIIDHPLIGSVLLMMALLDPLVISSHVYYEMRRTIIYDRDADTLRIITGEKQSPIHLGSSSLGIFEYYPRAWRAPGSGHSVMVLQDKGEKLIIPSILFESYELFSKLYGNQGYQRINRQINIIGLRDY